MNLPAARVQDSRFSYLRMLILVGALAVGAAMMAVYVQLLHEAVAKGAQWRTADLVAKPVAATDE